MNNQNMHRYDDMLDLPHHVSATRPQMSMLNRAAQFSPFAALTGYDDQVKETARLTDKKIELSEDEKELLDKKLRVIREQIDSRSSADHVNISITYFHPDTHKVGGEYVTVSGTVKKIDLYERNIIFYAENIASSGNSNSIAIDDILEIDIEKFKRD